MSDIKQKIKKMIYKNLEELPSNKALTIPDLSADFSTVTGESLTNYQSELKDVISELEQLGYIRFQNFGAGRIIKGINFDDWTKTVEKEKTIISIETIEAQQVQVGTQNVMTINNIPSEDLLRILEILVNDPEKGKNILSKLKDELHRGISTFELIQKLYKLGKSVLNLPLP